MGKSNHCDQAKQFVIQMCIVWTTTLFNVNLDYVQNVQNIENVHHQY